MAKSSGGEGALIIIVLPYFRLQANFFNGSYLNQFSSRLTGNSRIQNPWNPKIRFIHDSDKIPGEENPVYPLYLTYNNKKPALLHRLERFKNPA